MIKTIVAVDENWGIGKNGRMLVHIPGDLRYFKRKTLGKTVIMGRATLESLPKGQPLPDRTNIVLTRNQHLQGDFLIANSIKELMENLSDGKWRVLAEDDIFIIGGEQIYTQMLPYCNEAYVTKIRRKEAADTFFPNLDQDPDWEQISESDIQEDDGIEYTFCIYSRKSDRKQR